MQSLKCKKLINFFTSDEVEKERNYKRGINSQWPVCNFDFAQNNNIN
jgi:hypothetical protein